MIPANPAKGRAKALVKIAEDKKLKNASNVMGIVLLIVTYAAAVGASMAQTGNKNNAHNALVKRKLTAPDVKPVALFLAAPATQRGNHNVTIVVALVFLQPSQNCFSK